MSRFAESSLLLKPKRAEKRSHRALQYEKTDSQNTKPTPSKRRCLEDQPLFPKDRCLFCDKETFVNRRVKQKLITCVTKVAEETIKSAAVSKNDFQLLGKIDGVDLVAKEARYHSVCRRNYIRVTSPKPVEFSEDKKLQLAHEAASDFIFSYVEDYIITKETVERISMLKERYLLYMLENSPEFYNAQYRTFKLKDKLIKHFGNRIHFWQCGNQSEIVYSSNIIAGRAISLAFEKAGSEKRAVMEAAMILRRHIIIENNMSEKVSFPPTPSWIEETISPSPGLLQEFMAYLLSAKTVNLSQKSSRLVSSFCQDICYSVSSGKWIMPKHVSLAMTVRHLTGSAELISLLNRFGHCVSYRTTLDIESALCNRISMSASSLPTGISANNNAVTHFCWDNFDMDEETLDGRGTTHVAHGIVIQERLDPSAVLDDSLQQRTVDNDLERGYLNESPEPCFVSPKTEPVLVVNRTTPEIKEDAYSFDVFIWTYSRMMGQFSDCQMVPTWFGWLSAMSSNEQVESVVEYMPPVFHPITENSTVQKILEISQSASAEVKQQHTIVTFDLAVAKKAYAIIWEHNAKFRNVVVRLGVFHTISALFNALGKRMNGSGFSDIIMEAGICASGSIQRVLSGKHYNRSLRVHRITVEALERLLFVRFVQQEGDIPSDVRDLFEQLASIPNRENKVSIEESGSCRKLFLDYQRFRSSVRDGLLGKTAQFWMSYMDIVWMILALIKATKENNLEMHITSLYALCGLFFAYDHQNYARYVPVYLLNMLNLDETHPGAAGLLKTHNGFSVARSKIPATRNAVDITIEQTINRHAKSSGGIVGFSRNVSAYYRWCMTRHVRAQYLSTTLNMANMLDDDYSCHKENRPSVIKRNEEDTLSVIGAFSTFMNPFDVDDKDNLYCLSSGVPAPTDVSNDLMKAISKGNHGMEEFISGRLVKRETPFIAPIKRNKLKTFASMAISKKMSSSHNKVIELKAERNLFGQLMVLAIQHNIDLATTLTYPLGPVPWSLATSDGAPIKSDKAKLLHALESRIHPLTEKPDSKTTAFVCDGNALLHSIVALPESFGKIAERVFDMLPNMHRVDFITDTYKIDSIKEPENLRRGTSEKFLVSGPKTKAPRDWKNFLMNKENKMQLIRLLLSEWRTPEYAKRLVGKDLFFVCEENCYHLTSYDGAEVCSSLVEDLASTHEEADTRIILHCGHISSHSTDVSTIQVRSPDTDVFILLLKFSREITKTILFDTGTGNKRRLICISELAQQMDPRFCAALPAFHAFTGCDSTSFFLRRGKKTPLQKFENNPQYISTFRNLGCNVLSQQTIEELEKFVCLIYRRERYMDVNKLRYDMFMEKFGKDGPSAILTTSSGVDLSSLPPCRSSLLMHTKRSQMQALVWNASMEATPKLPNPEEHGWTRDSDGNLIIQWIDGPMVPLQLSDIIVGNELLNGDEMDHEEIELVNLEDEIFEDNA